MLVFRYMVMDDANSLCDQAVAYFDSNPEYAFSLFRKAMETGSANGAFGMAEMLLRGHGVKKDSDLAISMYKSAAEAGHAPAMYRLGQLCSGEFESTENPEKCREWFLRAAEAGLEDAYTEIAGIYMSGYGGPENFEAAFHWYSLAAEAGHADAMYAVSMMYGDGIGVKTDHEKSIAYMCRSAEAGYPQAMFSIGVVCHEGKIPGGIKKAVEWYESAVNAGFEQAKFNLATALCDADEKDLTRAFSLYKELADKGDADAMYMVGSMLLEGSGTEKDIESGFRYLGKSAASGNEAAMQIVESIRRRQNTQLIKIDGTE